MEDEDEEIPVKHERMEKELRKGDYCLVGKVHAERIISKGVLQLTMQKVWKQRRSLRLCPLMSITLLLFLNLWEIRIGS